MQHKVFEKMDTELAVVVLAMLISSYATLGHAKYSYCRIEMFIKDEC